MREKMVQSKIQQAVGRGAPYVQVLPIPIPINRVPDSNDICPLGQILADTSVTPNVLYFSLGNGTFATMSTTDIISIAGTANEVTVNTVGGAATVSLPSDLTAPGSITAAAGNITATNGDIVRGTAGNKDVYSSVATTTAAGANSAGTVTLSGGTATISTTAVTANSKIRLTRQGVGATGAAALGILTVGTITAGTSFVINAVQAADATALQASDVSSIWWELVN